MLKAGAAYLPLDPAYPQERLSFMLADAGAQVVVTEQALVGAVAVAMHRVDTGVSRRSSGWRQREHKPLLRSWCEAENAAYVIYTSGSTGRPKGVVVTHENVWRLLEVTQADFAFDERRMCGRCFIRCASIFRCGSCGEHWRTADGWWWCRTG